jgi:hypothetical protein
MFGVDPGVRRLLYGRQCCLAAVAKQQICSIWHLAHASFAENMELSLGILRRKVASALAFCCAAAELSGADFSS